MNNNRGQSFVALIGFILGMIILVFAAPIVNGIINEVVGGFGSATAFVVKLFLWVMLLVLGAGFIKIIASGEGFFA